jgi:hypothetical protein
MSGAAEAVQAALVAALQAHAPIAGVVSGIHDGPPARAAWPYVVIEDGSTSDWSHKSGRGRDHRIGITIWDDGATPARLHALMAEAEIAIEGIGATLDGHRLVSLIFLRARVVRDPEGPWAGFVQYRARTLEI